MGYMEEAVPVVNVANGGCGNGSGMFGGDGWWAIILFALIFGWGRGNGGYGGADGSGAAQNYVLASDFATIQRQLSDGFGGVEKGLDTIRNGICDGFYTEAQLVNGVNTNILQTSNAISAQLADCCCKTQTAIAGVNYNAAIANAGLQSQIERGFADTNYNMATQHCQTLQAIDKVGDRIVDYLNTEKMQTLRDENAALRLAASQSAQNNYLVNQLRPCPMPAYITCNPWASQANYGGCCGV